MPRDGRTGKAAGSPLLPCARALALLVGVAWMYSVTWWWAAGRPSWLDCSEDWAWSVGGRGWLGAPLAWRLCAGYIACTGLLLPGALLTAWALPDRLPRRVGLRLGRLGSSWFSSAPVAGLVAIALSLGAGAALTRPEEPEEFHRACLAALSAGVIAAVAVAVAASARPERRALAWLWAATSPILWAGCAGYPASRGPQEVACAAVAVLGVWRFCQRRWEDGILAAAGAALVGSSAQGFGLATGVLALSFLLEPENRVRARVLAGAMVSAVLWMASQQHPVTQVPGGAYPTDWQRSGLDLGLGLACAALLATPLPLAPAGALPRSREDLRHPAVLPLLGYLVGSAVDHAPPLAYGFVGLALSLALGLRRLDARTGDLVAPRLAWASMLAALGGGLLYLLAGGDGRLPISGVLCGYHGPP